MKPTRALTRLFTVLAVLIATSMAGPASTARAGWNGQQIMVFRQSSDILISNITINGPNQSGNISTFYRSFGFPGTSNIIYTTNSWWKGPVQIEIQASIPNPGLSKIIRCTINIPTVDTSSDWVKIGFNSSRSDCYRIY